MFLDELLLLIHQVLQHHFHLHLNMLLQNHSFPAILLYEGLHDTASCEEKPRVNFIGVLIQGIATSIDALSVGFTIADYNLTMALVASLVIAAVTFPICFSGLLIGKKAGTKLSGKSSILGGAILIFIGLEIFITSWF